MMLGNSTLAEEYFSKSSEIISRPSNLAERAYIELLKGSNDKAREHVQKYLEQSSHGVPVIASLRTILYFDNVLEKMYCNFFIGLCLFRLGDPSASQRYLEWVANINFNNYYSEYAQGILNEIAILRDKS